MNYSGNVTAVIGPTNTGKTHLAIERMLGHDSGLIGLPLRLLAREVYDRIVARIGPARVALITGEERIKPKNPSYYVCTVEAMPQDVDVDFLAIDEVQLAGDPERGHIFTDRILHARGNSETLLLGAASMRGIIEKLLPGTHFVTRPRLSKLTFGGQKKLSRLPRRTAIVTFSTEEVYSIAELIRRQRGGAAVVMGALSPRTRNAQVALYQSGDVDFLIATDAIGMGLNLDIDHVAFAGNRKFDGQRTRELSPGELSQIAGRAGRHMNDGTFGVTANVEPFEPSVIERLENHEFKPFKTVNWRNRSLDFSSIEALKESLKLPSDHSVLVRGRMVDDVQALENLSHMPEIRDRAMGPAGIKRLWEVCQVPDFRKISTSDHVELVANLFGFIMDDDPVIPEDWFASQVAFSDRTDGDIDTLANRIAHIRTWTFVSNKMDWLNDPQHWQEKTREIEDRLSDALHEKLTQRFVDKRTSVLMRRLRDEEELFAEIGVDGAVHVEKHLVGRLNGFVFTPEDQGEGINKKAAQGAAARVLKDELLMRVRRVVAAKHDAFELSPRGRISWKGAEIAKLMPGDTPLKPNVHLFTDEHLSALDGDKVQARLDKWIEEEIAEKLAPLASLSDAEDVSGLAKGVAFQLVENFGILRREDVGRDIASLDQTARATLRKYGIRFGAFNIFIPILLKPAASDLLLILWALKHGGANNIDIDNMPAAPRGGLTSVATDPALPKEFYKISGFHSCGPRSVRIDMLERLADMIRPLVAWRKPAQMESGKKPDDQKNSDGASAKTKTDGPPEGATGDGGFIGTASMMSILGCSPDELGQVLKALGFRGEKKILPVSEDQTTRPNASSAASDTGSETPQQVEDGAKGTAQAEPAPAEPAPVEPVSEEKMESVGATGAEEKDDEFIIVWRPSKRQRNVPPVKSRDGARAKRSKPRQSGAQSGAQSGRGRKQGAGGRAGNKDGARRSAARKPEKRMDPDSPFAALAKLKDKLEEKPKDKSTT